MTKDTNDSQSTAHDLRNGNLRYLGYSHIIGEIIRGWITRPALNITYVITTVYILADTFSQCKGTCNERCGRKTIVKGGDVLIWHSIASIFVPGFVTRRIKWGTGYWLMNIGAPRALRFNIPIAVGLLSIPLIIHPIDRLADYLMDETYRKYIE